MIIINGGTNDYLKGKKGDGVVTPEKFRVAFENLLTALQKKYPHAQLIVVVGDFVKGDYGGIAVETAKKFRAPCVDFRPDTKSIGKVFGFFFDNFLCSITVSSSSAFCSAGRLQLQ